MSNKIKLITSEVNNSEISIDSKNEFSLVYNDNNEQFKLTIENSKNRPIRISELNNKLIERDWNVFERRYIKFDKGKELLMLKKTNNSTDYIEKLNTEDNNLGIELCNLDNIPSETILEFESEYKDILNMKNTDNEIYLYSASNRVIDILNNTVSIDMISCDSDIYTDIIDLKNIIKIFPKSNLSMKIDLSVLYSKNGKIYNYDTTINGINYNIEDTKDSTVSIKNNPIIENINSDIFIEYTDLIIKVLPTSNLISECIINNCTITYGNLKK